MGPNGPGGLFRPQTYGTARCSHGRRALAPSIFRLFVFTIPPPIRFQHLIFDLGGVIINLDYAAPVAAFAALNDAPGAVLGFNQQAQAPLFDALETGHLADGDFRLALRRAHAIGPAVADAAIDAAWNAKIERQVAACKRGEAALYDAEDAKAEAARIGP